MDESAAARLLARQGGVISRRQVVGLEGTDNDIERMRRRRLWSPVHPGVYVDHTGPLTWQQRAWAAVLYYFPAALAGSSALRAHGVRTGAGTADGPIVVTVDRSRRVRPISGVRVLRIRGYTEAVLDNRCPPRLRLEHALLDEAAEARDDDEALAILADACQARLTTPQRLVDTLAGRTRLRRRRWLGDVLTDVADGAYSVLERRYLRDVERAHRLPTGRRQCLVRHHEATSYRDVEYSDSGVVVELDGRLAHERTQDRWSDLDRDVDAAAGGAITVRLGWRQVLQPCRTAARLARILRARGWAGQPSPCSATCLLASWAA